MLLCGRNLPLRQYGLRSTMPAIFAFGKYLHALAPGLSAISLPCSVSFPLLCSARGGWIDIGAPGRARNTFSRSLTTTVLCGPRRTPSLLALEHVIVVCCLALAPYFPLESVTDKARLSSLTSAVLPDWWVGKGRFFLLSLTKGLSVTASRAPDRD